MNDIPEAYEVDPLRCPWCGGEMRLVSFIDEDKVIQKRRVEAGIPIFFLEAGQNADGTTG